MFGRTAFVIVAAIIMLSVFRFEINNVGAPEEPIIKIVDPQTGSSLISLGNPVNPMPPGGYNFTINVILSGTAPSLFLYQIGLKFNITNLRCTATWIPKTDPNFVFYGRQTVEGSPQIDNVNLGYAFLGAVLLNRSQAVDVSQGLFVKANFTVVKTGTFTIDIVPTTLEVTDPYYGKDTFIMRTDQYGMLFDIPFIPQDVSVVVNAMISPPVPVFDIIPPNPKANETVTFDASASFDPDGLIVSYHWDFGDGSNCTITESSITHVFAHNGLFSVNLTTTDNDGLNSSKVREIMVGEIPSPAFTCDPLNPYRGNTTTFNASQSYDLDGSISLYVWDFADGTNQTASEPSVTHAYSQNGVFDVRLTVFDNDGLYNFTSKQVFVGKAPMAEFTLSPENPLPNEEIMFDASLSYDLDGQIVHAIWDFNDMNVTEVDIASPADLVTAHTYLVQGGVYSVNLTVFDNDGLFASIIHDVNVTIIYRGGYVVFNVVWEYAVYRVLLLGNSTVTHFNFNQSLAQIRFEVSGVTGTAGYCNITIPKTLLKGNPWNVKVNGEPWTYSLLENSSHYFIYLNYTHASTLQVTIQGTWVVPEFPPTVILPLFILLTTLLLAFKRKRIRRPHAAIRS